MRIQWYFKFLTILEYHFKILPLSSAKVELVKCIVVLHHVLLSSEENQVGSIRTKSVVSQSRWVVLATAHLDLIPLRGQVVELGFNKLVENSLLHIVPAMNVNFAGLNTGGKIWPGCKLATEFQFNPSGINLFLFVGFGKIDFEVWIFMVFHQTV